MSSSVCQIFLPNMKDEQLHIPVAVLSIDLSRNLLQSFSLSLFTQFPINPDFLLFSIFKSVALAPPV